MFLPAVSRLHQNRFGEALGEKVWESCNAVFDRLPLAGVIDQDIFCVHGGIPRPLSGSSSRIQVRAFVYSLTKAHTKRKEKTPTYIKYHRPSFTVLQLRVVGRYRKRGIGS